jgi:class 3 adenylate cyclase
VTGRGSAESLPASRHCLLFAVDIVRFSNVERDNRVQLVLRDALYRMLMAAFAASGIRWGMCLVEDRGDGAIVEIPAQVPTSTLVDSLADEIRMRLRRHNRLANEPEQIRLRVAVHIGEVHHDPYGLAGVAVTEVFRLLDSAAARAAAEVDELALIVSNYFFDSVIRTRAGAIGPQNFRPVTVVVKQFRGRAWLLLEDALLPAQPGADVTPVA